MNNVFKKKGMNQSFDRNSGSRSPFMRKARSTRRGLNNESKNRIVSLFVYHPKPTNRA